MVVVGRGGIQVVLADHPDLDIERFRVGFQRFVVLPHTVIHAALVVVGRGGIQVFVAEHGYEHLLCLPEVKKSLFMILQRTVYRTHI